MITQKTLIIPTLARKFYDITHHLNACIVQTDLTCGICHVFIHHTSASLLITENADEDVKTDLEQFMQKIAPDRLENYLHTAEGKDDMPAHIRSMLTPISLSIPFNTQGLLLGTWQSVYIWEHRFQGHQRKITLTLMGE